MEQNTENQQEKQEQLYQSEGQVQDPQQIQKSETQQSPQIQEPTLHEATNNERDQIQNLTTDQHVQYKDQLPSSEDVKTQEEVANAEETDNIKAENEQEKHEKDNTQSVEQTEQTKVDDQQEQDQKVQPNSQTSQDSKERPENTSNEAQKEQQQETTNNTQLQEENMQEPTEQQQQSENVVRPGEEVIQQAAEEQQPADSSLQRGQSLAVSMPSFRRRSTRPHSSLQGTFVTTKGRLLTVDEIHQSCERLSVPFGMDLLHSTSTPTLKSSSCGAKLRLMPQDEIDEMVDRLYTSHPPRAPPGPRPSVTLKIQHDQNGRPQELWEPVKKVTAGEKTDAMVELYNKCHENKAKTWKELEDKYLQPLCKVKMIEPKDKDEHMEKINKLYKGMGVGS